jgi:FtsZ-interacting cell division protein ZipA
MTDLQISLIAIGAVTIVGVILYNKWQENKTRKMLERAFSSLYDDVLMTPNEKDGTNSASAATDRQEPGFGNASVQSQDPAAPIEPVIAPVTVRPPVKGSVADAYLQHDEDMALMDEALSSELIEPSLVDLAADQVAKRAKRNLPVDELIDCRIPIELETPVWGEKILPALQSLRYVGNKPVNFIGCNAQGEWESIHHGGMYSSLIAGVQMANRSSALNELEYSELVMQLRNIADAMGGEIDVPDMVEVIQTSQRLQQFIADHDVQLGVNVVSNSGPWNVKTLLAALSRQGFDRYTDGYLMMQDGEGEVLFSLSTNATANQEETNRLTLLLDVPRVGVARNGYAAMVACGKSLATRLNGTLVDDSVQPLTDEMLNDIGEQVAAFYNAMESVDIMAGSKRAQRLFS